MFEMPEVPVPVIVTFSISKPPAVSLRTIVASVAFTLIIWKVGFSPVLASKVGIDSTLPPETNSKAEAVLPFEATEKATS